MGFAGFIPVINSRHSNNGVATKKQPTNNQNTDMKTLHLRRHSIKDGANNTIGTKGLQLAFEEGIIAHLAGSRYKKLFHGQLIRTAQTALAFCQGFGYVPAVMPVMDGLGDDALFAEIANAGFKAAVASGLSNFAATRQVHGDEQASIWAHRGCGAVETMFFSMNDNEVGVGFFHSPTIELVAWHYGAEHSEIDGWDQLKDMEGLVFACDDSRIILVAGKISVKTNAAK